MLKKIIFVVFMLSGSLFANEHLPIYDVGEVVNFHDFPVHMVVDKTQKMKIEEVVASPVKNSIRPSRYSFPLGKENTWYGFSLKNTANRSISIIIAFDESFLKHADLYTLAKSRWTREKNGLSVPIDKRSIFDPNPAFSVFLKKGEIKKIYLMASTESKMTSVGIRISDKKTYTK